MSKADTMRKKADELQSHIEAISGKVTKKEKAFPIMMAVGAVIPFVTFAALYFIQPGFVQKKDGTKYVRSTAKTFYWTLGISIAIWAVLFALKYFGMTSCIGC